MNIAELITRLEELVIEPFDRGEFVFKFIAVFNPPPATLTKMKKAAQKELDPGAELLWPRKMLYRVAEPGQTASTIDALKSVKIAKNKAPRFLVSTDGEEFSALDTKLDVSLHCDFDKISREFSFFLNLAGIETYEALEEAKADVKASVSLSKLYDEIIRTNPDWHTPELRHALNQFMTRILFCLFAEDTGSFAKDLFVRAVNDYGGEDGEQVQTLLRQVFQVMNVPDADRGDTPAHITTFPYVNGGLFADDTKVPAFSKRAKRLLVEAAGLDWGEINPDIFGSMIQAVVDPNMRGDLGMHYTSVPNIMKVLQPLFLMSLEEELDKAIGHREERSMLSKLLKRIHKIRVFDPACGSGNFLIIAYRELRKLEMRIFKREEELNESGLLAAFQSGVKLSNFYGIEIADFAAETAKLSLWIAEYQMNQRFKNLFGEAPPDFPLKEGGHIFTGNALREDWLEICPPPMKTVHKEKVFDLATIAPVQATQEVIDEEVKTYICGNPPFQGVGKQKPEHKEDLKEVFSGVLKKYKSLDYVTGWHFKAIKFLDKVNGQMSLVSTNSITQGQQVPVLWPLILKHGYEIGFAHRSFWWSNNASKKAAVTCVIIGLRKMSDKPKYIFENEFRRKADNIGPYLIEMENIFVESSDDPITPRRVMVKGSQATDDGNLLLNRSEMEKLVDQYPQIQSLVRRFYGSQELTKGIERWCLWINENDIALAESIEPISERLRKVTSFRQNSDKPATRAFSDRPHRFTERRHRERECIVIPKSTSERRGYITASIISEGSVISDQAFALYDAPPAYLGILLSKLHFLWGATVGGRFKLDPRYSNTIVYNTFPLPPFNDDQKQALEDHAWQIIAARAEHPGKTIAWLYDPKTMPDNLLVAHKALDNTFEKIYIGRPFKNDTERLEHLFKMYAEMTAKEVA